MRRPSGARRLQPRESFRPPPLRFRRPRAFVSGSRTQTVADMLASKGFKKGQCDKALMALAGQGKIIVKEFGKTKLFIPLQDGLEALGPEVRTIDRAPPGSGPWIRKR